LLRHRLFTLSCNECQPALSRFASLKARPSSKRSESCLRQGTLLLTSETYGAREFFLAGEKRTVLKDFKKFCGFFS
jgi:hypothetical protein